MRRWKIKLILKLRNEPMSLEIVLSREYFSLIDENGKELSNTCSHRVRYCVREEGSTKILKCFSTHDKAKNFIAEMEEEKNKAKLKK